MTRLLHIWFVCDKCGRLITGCLQSCPGDHRIEPVESCAICQRQES
jgi:hypothetical protein